MAQGEGLVQQETTAALRARSGQRLASGFATYVAVEARAKGWDPRDTMIDLVPFLDCARRLGLDPASALGPIAAAGPAWFRETFDAFVRRSDVTLEAFGWSLLQAPDGPKYRFAFPS
jgi:hypothetical protein